MPRFTLRRVSHWTALALLSASCATYSEPEPSPGGGGSSSDGGEPSAGVSGSNSLAGSLGAGAKAGSEAAGTAGSEAAGTTTGGTTATEGGTAGATTTGGEPPITDAGAGSGGAPDPGCSQASDCNDKNPCTDDACVDSVCQYTNNTSPCADDADDCTDDVCAAGACTHPANTAPCEDDLDDCTSDVCAGDICTHPSNGTCMCQKAADCNDQNPCTTDSCVGNQCKYVNNALGCVNDGNPCTTDVCEAGACQHKNNTASCTDDGDACTGDVCAAGQCTHPAISGCCSGDGDCYDGNVCTDESCVNHVCQKANNTVACPGDTSPCTGDVCGAGDCKHPTNAVCSGSDNVVIFTNRNGRYVVLNGNNLDWTGTSVGNAEVFEKVGEVGTKFKLRARSTGLYVTLGAADALVATADLATAILFDAPTCGAQPWVGLSATTDTNGGTFAATDDGGHITARSGDCGAANAGSWEKFQLVSVSAPCANAADCNDNNACTDEVCANGFCAYTDHAGTCADDGSACTDDVCVTGTCTHPGNGTCVGPLVTIQANRDGKFVVLNAQYLEYTAATSAAAEKFELVDKVGAQFKLRASNSLFVTLDATDNLIANAAFAGAMLFDSPACDVKVALVATGDDDAQKYVASDDGAGPHRLIARSGACNPASAGSYEKFTLAPAP
jgi:hypothetical protein